MAFKFSDGQSEITGDYSRLEKLIKGLKEKHSVDIGVFKDAKTPDGKQVAEYGAYNEFGSIVVKDRPPKRSFIRMPIEQKQEKIETYVSGKAQGHLETGDVKAIFQDIGIACESVIQEAFDTSGFGTWAPDADSTVARKGSGAVLIGGGVKKGVRVVGGLLRKSVTYEVDR